MKLFKEETKNKDPHSAFPLFSFPSPIWLRILHGEDLNGEENSLYRDRIFILSRDTRNQAVGRENPCDHVGEIEKKTCQG